MFALCIENMIENPNPETWQDLQGHVNQILNEIGLKSEAGKVISTPRGTVEIDVYAVDTNSIDKIKYIIECKNWASFIPQTVVHAFTTVMHESGGNIGYIISKRGLQPGAVGYTKNTNIQGITFSDFQEKYFQAWFNNYFAPYINGRADDLIQYTEPFNSRRTRYLDKLSDSEYHEYNKLCEKYSLFAVLMCMISAEPLLQRDGRKVPNNIDEFKNKISISKINLDLQSIYFRDLLIELSIIIDHATDEFNNLFNENIFAQQNA